MVRVIVTDDFDKWLATLRDRGAKSRIVARMRSTGKGNIGDIKQVDRSLFEMRIHTGKGYRLYFTRRGDSLFVFLHGGIKSTQSRDIKTAKLKLKQFIQEFMKP